MYNYRIYLYRDRGYELEETTQEESRIDYYITRKDKDYARLLVIRHDLKLKSDLPYVLKFFDSTNVKKRQRIPKKH
jgi:hypothetical protein